MTITEQYPEDAVTRTILRRPAPRCVAVDDREGVRSTVAWSSAAETAQVSRQARRAPSAAGSP